MIQRQAADLKDRDDKCSRLKRAENTYRILTLVIEMEM